MILLHIAPSLFLHVWVGIEESCVVVCYCKWLDWVVCRSFFFLLLVFLVVIVGRIGVLACCRRFDCDMVCGLGECICETILLLRLVF